MIVLDVERETGWARVYFTFAPVYSYLSGRYDTSPQELRTRWTPTPKSKKSTSNKPQESTVND